MVTRSWSGMGWAEYKDYDQRVQNLSYSEEIEIVFFWDIWHIMVYIVGNNVMYISKSKSQNILTMKKEKLR